MEAVQAATANLSIVASCDALGVSRASWYRWRAPPAHGPVPRRLSHRALSGVERAEVLALMHEERFVERAPAEIYATLLDEGRCPCSISTMYRILHANAEVRERRDQLRHPAYALPQLLATAPNQLWSWDITKLPGPQKWHYFHLYVILDVFSRYIVGWMIAHRESAVLADRLIAATLERQQVPPGQLTLHADRGAAMRSKVVAQLLADLGVVKTHSRPHVSNDNPYSEAGFKTMKYHPGFPKNFGCIEDAHAHVHAFVHWYNHVHRHAGIALLTPWQVHQGIAEKILADRLVIRQKAYDAHPERHPNGPPKLQVLPAQVWINRPLPPDLTITPEPQCS